MKNHYFNSSMAAITMLFCGATANAQSASFPSRLVPSNPTSTQSITYLLAGDVSCTRRAQRYKSIAMVNNNIIITFTEKLPTGLLQTGVPPPWTDEFDAIDLGRLPPGDYTLSTVDAPCKRDGILVGTDLNKFGFKVNDGRPKNSVASPTIDYSGHWWDENDPGWGLFMWHDDTNNLMAAWFTYTAEGKPAWYVFQPTWQRQDLTTRADILQTDKPPGSSSPPTGTTQFTTVGTASLGFFFNKNPTVPAAKIDELYAVLNYKLADGVDRSRSLTRFKAK